MPSIPICPRCGSPGALVTRARKTGEGIGGEKIRYYYYVVHYEGGKTRECYLGPADYYKYAAETYEKVLKLGLALASPARKEGVAELFMSVAEAAAELAPVEALPRLIEAAERAVARMKERLELAELEKKAGEGAARPDVADRMLGRAKKK